MVKIHGPKWAEIAKKMPQRAGRRPAQHLKNNWNRLVNEARKPPGDSSSGVPQKDPRGSSVEQISAQQHRGKGHRICVTGQRFATRPLTIRCCSIFLGGDTYVLAVRPRRVVKEKRPREAPGCSDQTPKGLSLTASPRTPHLSKVAGARPKKQQRTGSHDGNGSQKSRARSSSQSLRWAAGEARISIRDNGSVRYIAQHCLISRSSHPRQLSCMLIVDAGAQLASYDSNGGLDGYWETVVCSYPVMRSGCHSASFTVVRGGRTLHVGVVRRSVEAPTRLAPSGNLTDTSAGWGFDSESGGCVVTIIVQDSSSSCGRHVILIADVP